MSVLKFYYDFHKCILEPGSYELLGMDTGSICIALHKEKFKDSVMDMPTYESLRDKCLILECNQFGVRQRNRYRVECEEHVIPSQTLSMTSLVFIIPIILVKEFKVKLYSVA